MRYLNRKTFIIRESNRSSDFITPSFGHGCEYKCNYCYMRRNVPTGLTIAKNTNQIIDSIARHLWLLDWPKKPNQTHDKYYTYDFSCNEDYVLHAKYHEWEKLFDYFVNEPKAMGTAATKYVGKRILKYNPKRKIRIRFSLMPQFLSDMLEPGTPKIIDRIRAINEYYDAGYDVHINYSPIVMFKGFKQSYGMLFEMIDKLIDDDIKQNVKAECIFLIHNKVLHAHNVENETQGEEYLWQPGIQENKLSEYGGENIRYDRHLKKGYIRKFLKLHKKTLPWQHVRYIF